MEMLVVLAIIATVTSIALFGQTTFNRSLVLTDTAYTIALSLREAQSLGLSSRAFGAVQNAAYGGRFTGNASSFLIFADIGGSSPPPLCPVGTVGTPDRKPGNCIYNAGVDGIVETYNLTRGLRIRRICGVALSGGSRYCSTDSTPLTAIDIVFMRSNTTDTIITGQRTGTVPLSKAEIYLEDADGASSRAICVSQVGQISVVAGTCP